MMANFNKLLLGILLILIISQVFAFSGGTGTSGDPYRVNACADIDWMDTNASTKSAYYVLDSNVDCGVSPYNTGSGFTQVTGFAGSLDGQGYWVKNLMIYLPTTNNVSPFAAGSAFTIKNIGFDVNITGQDYVSGFMTDYLNRDLNNIKVSGTIIGRNYVGGITSRSNAGIKITNSSVDLTLISGNEYVGGLAAYYGGDFNYCTIKINRIEGQFSVGGASGWMFNGSNGVSYIQNTTADINLLKVTHTSANGYYTLVGGLVGRFSSSGFIRSANVRVNLIDVNNATADPGKIGGLVGGHDRAGGYLYDVNFTGTINYRNTSGAAYLGGIVGHEESGPITYSRADINIDTNLSSASGTYVGGIIGSSSYDLNNIYVNSSYIYAAGTNGNYVGGVGGSSSAVYNAVADIGEVRGLSQVGGLLGGSGIAAGVISSRLNAKTIVGTTTEIGGFIGYAKGDVNYCDSNVQILIGSQYVGGLLGNSFNQSDASSKVYMTNSYVRDMNVTNPTSVGGLVGRFSGRRVERSFAEVKRLYVDNSVGNDALIGGLIGQTGYSDWTIRDSNSRAQIDYTYSGASNNSYIGGIAGNTGTPISGCRADVNIDADLGTKAPNYVGGITGKSTGTITNSHASGAYIKAKNSGGTGVGVGGISGSSYTVYNSTSNFIDINGNLNVSGISGNLAIGDVNGSTATISGILYGKYNIGGAVGNGANNSVAVFNSGATINKIYADNSTANDMSVGGVVGVITNARTVTGCWARIGTIYAKNTSASNTGGVGGVAGYVYQNSNNAPMRDSNAIVSLIQYESTSTGDAFVGGLAGRQMGLVSNSWADVNIDASIGTYTGGYVGGLVGYAYGVVSNSWARGNYIKATKTNSQYVGGLVGRSTGITNSYSIFSDINGLTKVGGLGGYSSGAVLDSNSVLNSVNGTSNVGGLIGLGDSDVNRSKTIIGTITGTMLVGGVIGELSNSSTFMYDLSADVNLIKVTHTAGGQINAGGIIGLATNTKGMRQAAARIKLMDINNSSGSDAGGIGGIAGYLYHNANTAQLLDANSTVQINYTNSSTGAGYIGGVVGLHNGYISNSWADSNINAELGTRSGTYVGGLAGNAASYISNSYSTGGNILASKTGGGYVGGLAGRIGGAATNVYALYNDVNGVDYTGGLIGSGQGAVNTYTINRTVYGADRVGGLIGYSRGDINTSYSGDANVIGSTNVGGITGYYDPPGTTYHINNSFTTTRVTGSSVTGAVTGYVVTYSWPSPPVVNTYYTFGSAAAGRGTLESDGPSYFKGKGKTLLGITQGTSPKHPYANPDANWNFNYTGHPGLWYGWQLSYPHFTTDPIVTYVPNGEYQSRAIDLSSMKKCIALTTNMIKPTDSNIKIQIQVADNNTSWWASPNWMGPDGTDNTYYSNGSYSIPDINADGNWIRWRAVFTSSSDSLTPTLISIDFNCIPIGEMVLIANGNNLNWRGIAYNAITGGINGSLEWLYKIGSGNWDSIDNNSFPALTTGTPLYIKAIMTGTIDSNGPIMDNNIVLSYRPN